MPWRCRRSTDTWPLGRDDSERPREDDRSALRVGRRWRGGVWSCLQARRGGVWSGVGTLLFTRPLEMRRWWCFFSFSAPNVARRPTQVTGRLAPRRNRPG